MYLRLINNKTFFMKTKSFFLSVIIVMQVTACQNRQLEQTQYNHWICQQGEHEGAEIVFARMDNAFRGEYIDPGFQDRVSIPIMGTIDDEGNVTGLSAAIPSDGNIIGKLSGKITEDKFMAVWSPMAMDMFEYREMELKLEKLSPEQKKETGKHPGAFYNFLFPEQVLMSNSGERKSRVVPFLPETSVPDRTYGYSIGEWEVRYIHLAPGAKKDEVDFHLHIEVNGQYSIETDIQSTAQLSGNAFRYKKKGYEFEVVVYNDFVVIKTIAGSIDLNGQEGELKVDGIYPASMEMNFYADED